MKNIFKNLGRILDFQFILPDDERIVCHNIGVLKRNRVEIRNMRQASILNEDGSSIENVYILICKGNLKTFEKIKRVFCLKEIKYEGMRTLI